jgi:hypothetical protein
VQGARRLRPLAGSPLQPSGPKVTFADVAGIGRRANSPRSWTSCEIGAIRQAGGADPHGCCQAAGYRQGAARAGRGGEANAVLRSRPRSSSKAGASAPHVCATCSPRPGRRAGCVHRQARHNRPLAHLRDRGFRGTTSASRPQPDPDGVDEFAPRPA